MTIRRAILHLVGFGLVALTTFKWLMFPVPEEYSSCLCQLQKGAHPLGSHEKTTVIQRIAVPNGWWCMASVSTSTISWQSAVRYTLFDGSPTCSKVGKGASKAAAALIGFLSVSMLAFWLARMALLFFYHDLLICARRVKRRH